MVVPGTARRPCHQPLPAPTRARRPAPRCATPPVQPDARQLYHCLQTGQTYDPARPLCESTASQQSQPPLKIVQIAWSRKSDDLLSVPPAGVYRLVQMTGLGVSPSGVALLPPMMNLPLSLIALGVDAPVLRPGSHSNS